MRKLVPLLALILLLTGRAAPQVQVSEATDLGNNLSYVRVRSLADSAPALKSALSVKHACVLDVRYATATTESIAAFRIALTEHPAGTALFILVSPNTPTGVIDAINPKAPASYITLGIAGSNPSPKITVQTAANTDRQAYDAFDHGTPIADLISGKLDKDRFDEAALVQEFKSGNPAPEPPTPATHSETKSTQSAEKTAALTDRVLQRAIHLHQALLALRRTI